MQPENPPAKPAKFGSSTASLSIIAGFAAIAIALLVFVTGADWSLLMLVPTCAILGLYFGVIARNERGHELQARGGILLNALVFVAVTLFLFYVHSMFR